MTEFRFPRDLKEFEEELRRGVEVAGSYSISSIVEKRDVDRVVQSRAGLLSPPTRECASHKQWFLYGSGITASTGQIRIPLTEYLCNLPDNVTAAERFAGQDIPWFVATPVAKSPRYLTYAVDLVLLPNPSSGVYVPWPAVDVFVEVYSWLPNGDPAPFVQFSWHCAVNYTQYYNP